MRLHYILTAFKSEWLKIKGLGLVYTGVAISSIIPIIVFIASFFGEDEKNRGGGLTTSIYQELLESFYGAYGNFLLLIFIIIAATRIAQSDHRNNGWTFMETQPLSKFSIYMGKFLSVLVLTTISIVAFYLFVILSATLIQLVFPSESYSLTIDFGYLFHSFIRLWILSLGVISIQMMLSMIFSGFIWPFIIGFLGFVLNVIATVRGEVYNFIIYNNVSVGTGIKDPTTLNSYFNYTEYLSLFWTVVFFIIGYVIYSQKGIKNAFFKSGKKIAFTLIGLGMIVCAYFLLIYPKPTQKLDGETIIEGTIKTNQNVKSVILLEKELMTSIAEIPVEKGTFKWETKENIPFGEYVISINRRNHPIYLASGDDIYLDIKLDERNTNFLEKGTRKAENEFKQIRSFIPSEFDYVVDNKEMLDDPKCFYKLARDKWNDQKKTLDKFRSSENIALSDDFKEFMFQKLTIEMLNHLHEYQKMTSFTDKKYAIPEDFKNDLLNQIKKPLQAIFTDNSYKDWKINQFIPVEGTSNPDSIILTKIHQMPKGEEKDRLLSTEMIKLMKLNDNKEDCESFFGSYVNEFKNDKYKQYVASQLALINNQKKGAIFPNFIVESDKGKAVDLVNVYKGKYVIIDWWATWCGPCKQTKPAFEYEANKYKRYDNIVFVSISVDEDKKAWQMSIKNDKSNVDHFWLSNKEVMGTLNIQSIPRFMIIDPKGKMYNADLARPGESNFRESMAEITN